MGIVWLPAPGVVLAFWIEHSHGGAHPGFHTEDPRWDFTQRAPVGLSYNGPRPGPQSVGPDQAFTQRALTRLSYDGPPVGRPRPSFLMTDLGRALSRGLGWAFIQQAPAGLSVGGTLPGFHRAGPPGQTLSRSAGSSCRLSYNSRLHERLSGADRRAGPSESGPQPSFIWRVPAGPSVSTPLPGFHTAGPQSLHHCRAFIRRAQAGL